MSELAVGVKVSLIDRFLEPARRIAQASDKFTATLARGQTELEKLGKSSQLIERYAAQEKALGRTATRYAEAREEVAKLGRAMAEAETPSKRLEAAFDAARKRSGALRDQHRAQKTVLGSLRDELRGAGVDTRRLGEAQESVQARIKGATEAMERQAQLQAKVEAIGQVRAQALERAAHVALVAGYVERVGQQVTRAVSAPLTRSIDFESAMADVDKFVKGANLPVLRKQILDLGKSSPLGAQGVAQLVAAAGRINLPADEALEFAKLTEQLSVALGLSVDQAADTITTIKSGMNLDADGVKRLGDAINYFGDNSASNAPNIALILSRIGAVGQHAGLSGAQLAAFSAVLDGFAPNAEMAATSGKNILNALTAGEAAAAPQQEMLRSLGFDPADIAARMQDDAVGTLRGVLDAIRDEAPELRSGIIETLFGRESQSAVASLVGNLAEYDKVMGAARDETAFLGSAAQEYARTAQTNAFKLQQLRARWDATMIKLGDKLLPMLERVLPILVGGLDVLANLMERFPDLSTGIAVGVAGLGALAVVFAPLIAAAATLTTMFISLRASAALGGARVAAGGKAGGLATISKGLLSAGRLTAKAITGAGKLVLSAAKNPAVLAAAGGYAVGTVINDTLVDGTPVGDWIGAALHGDFGAKRKDRVDGVTGTVTREGLLADLQAQQASLTQALAGLARAGDGAEVVRTRTDLEAKLADVILRVERLSRPGDSATEVEQAVPISARTSQVDQSTHTHVSLQMGDIRIDGSGDPAATAREVRAQIDAALRDAEARAEAKQRDALYDSDLAAAY